MHTIHSVQRAIDYIENHLNEHLELKQVADAAFMSVPNLYRAFYSLTGHPIKEYVRNRRLSISAWNLRFSKKSILDIAFECGFDSYQAFTKIFKKRIGITPGAYRESEVHYSFEAIDLSNTIGDSVDKELFQRYSTLKIQRFAPAKVAVYQYESSTGEGIEEKSLHSILSTIERLKWGRQRFRLFGYNVELPSKEKPHGYRIMIPLTEGSTDLVTDDFLTEWFPEGLYAVSRSFGTDGGNAISVWDHLQSEWLPKSAFKLGENPFIEEYLIDRGAATHVKLFLPVIRKLESEPIETCFVKPFTVLGCRAVGPTAQQVADGKMTEWLINGDMPGTKSLRLFMSYSYGVQLGEQFWYELSASIPTWMTPYEGSEGFSLRTSYLGGGLYACLTTGAYGIMTGVLDRIHRWLSKDERYSLDENRQWFAEYIPGEGKDIERSTWVRCYVPIISTHREQDHSGLFPG